MRGRAQEERAVRETKRVRRANQRRSMHQLVGTPRAGDVSALDGADSGPKDVALDVYPFNEMEELT